jgi:hypothetical protein
MSTIDRAHSAEAPNLVCTFCTAPSFLDAEGRVRCAAARRRRLQPVWALDEDHRNVIAALHRELNELNDWCCDQILPKNAPIVLALSSYVKALTDRDCWMLQSGDISDLVGVECAPLCSATTR